MSAAPLYLWQVDDGERHWVVAHDADEAVRVCAAAHDIPYDEFVDCEPVAIRLPDDHAVSVRYDDEFPEFVPDPAAPDFEVPNPKRRKEQSAAAWVAEIGKPEMIASTCY